MRSRRNKNEEISGSGERCKGSLVCAANRPAEEEALCDVEGQPCWRWVCPCEQSKNCVALWVFEAWDRHGEQRRGCRHDSAC